MADDTPFVPPDPAGAPGTGGDTGMSGGMASPQHSRLVGILRNLAPALAGLQAMNQPQATPFPVSGTTGVINSLAGAGNVRLAAQQSMFQEGQRQRMLSLLRSPAYASMQSKLAANQFENLTPGELYMMQMLGMPEAKQFVGAGTAGKIETTKGGITPSTKEIEEAGEKGGQAAGTIVGAMQGGQYPLAGQMPSTPAELTGTGTFLRGKGIEEGGQARMTEAATNDAYKMGLLGIEKTKAEAWAKEAHTKGAAQVDAAIRSRVVDRSLSPDQANAMSDYVKYMAGLGPLPDKDAMKQVMSIPTKEGMEAEAKTIAAGIRSDQGKRLLEDRVAATFPKGNAPPELLNAIAKISQKGGVPEKDAAWATIDQYLPPTQPGKPMSQMLKEFFLGATGGEVTPAAAGGVSDEQEYQSLVDKAGKAGNKLPPVEAKRLEELYNKLHGGEGGK